jgi:hypothetical protein
MLKRTKKLTNCNRARQATLKIKVTLIPTENQIFMACLDAHLYGIEYTYSAFVKFGTNSIKLQAPISEKNRRRVQLCFPKVHVAQYVT